MLLDSKTFVQKTVPRKSEGTGITRLKEEFYSFYFLNLRDNICKEV
jgi:hypothetical protein